VAVHQLLAGQHVGLTLSLSLGLTSARFYVIQHTILATTISCKSQYRWGGSVQVKVVRAGRGRERRRRSCSSGLRVNPREPRSRNLFQRQRKKANRCRVHTCAGRGRERRRRSCSSAPRLAPRRAQCWRRRGSRARLRPPA